VPAVQGGAARALDEYGGTRTITGVDGPEHRRLREVMRRGYSREAPGGQARRTRGDHRPVPRAGLALGDGCAGGHRDPVHGDEPARNAPDRPGTREYITHPDGDPLHPQPPWSRSSGRRSLLKRSKYRRAKSRVNELGEQMIRNHRNRLPATGDRRTLVGDIMDAHDRTPRSSRRTTSSSPSLAPTLRVSTLWRNPRTRSPVDDGPAICSGLPVDFPDGRHRSALIDVLFSGATLAAGSSSTWRRRGTLTAPISPTAARVSPSRSGSASCGAFHRCCTAIKLVDAVYPRPARRRCHRHRRQPTGLNWSIVGRVRSATMCGPPPAMSAAARWRRSQVGPHRPINSAFCTVFRRIRTLAASTMSPLIATAPRPAASASA